MLGFFFYEDALGHARTSRPLFSTLIKALKKTPQTSSGAFANKHINTHPPIAVEEATNLVTTRENLNHTLLHLPFTYFSDYRKEVGGNSGWIK